MAHRSLALYGVGVLLVLCLLGFFFASSSGYAPSGPTSTRQVENLSPADRRPDDELTLKRAGKKPRLHDRTTHETDAEGQRAHRSGAEQVGSSVSSSPSSSTASSTTSSSSTTSTVSHTKTKKPTDTAATTARALVHSNVHESCASGIHVSVPSSWRQWESEGGPVLALPPGLCALEDLAGERPHDAHLPPPRLTGTPADNSAPFRQWPAPRCVVAMLRGSGARVTGERGVVFNSTHALTNARWHRQALPDHPRPTHLLKLDVPVVSLVIQWGEEYQHAILETLPRLALVLDALALPLPPSTSGTLPTAPSVCKQAADADIAAAADIDWKNAVILHNRGRGVHALLQAVLGIPAERLVEAAEDAVYEAPAVVFPTLAGQAKIGVVPPGAYAPLASRLQSAVARARGDSPLAAASGNDPGKKLFPTLLYLRRAPGATRSMHSADDRDLRAGIAQRLRRNWRLHIWDDETTEHGWQSDAPVFGSAHVIVGMHGGAFANLIFAPAAASVVEIIPRTAMEAPSPGSPKRDVRPCYHSLTEALGQRYVQFEPRSSRASFFDAKDIRVNVTALLDVLTDLQALDA